MTTKELNKGKSITLIKTNMDKRNTIKWRGNFQ